VIPPLSSVVNTLKNPCGWRVIRRHGLAWK
jgi:hypothetical protein